MAETNSQPAEQPKHTLWKRLAMVAGGIAVLGSCLAVRHYWGPEAANAKGPVAAPAAATKPAGPAQPATLQVVAIVNGEEIGRNDLARYCLWHYGKPVLESVVNKRLIIDRCRELNLEVTQVEVDQEIDRVARKFGLPVDQWIKMLKDERNITAQQYGNDIIWPTLALRKLASKQMQVTPQELAKAKETQYGPAVKARLIACNDEQKARQVHAKALANPEDFGNLAKDYSDDVNSASTKGLIQPIRRHMGDAKIELAAFNLQPGQVSEVIPAGNQFVILKCEELLPPRQVPKNYEAALTETIRESKLRDSAGEIFKELQSKAVVQNVFSDAEKSKQMPGVAALVNNRKITTLELAEECINRHGTEVLANLITRRVLEQVCKKRNIVVTEQDEDEEIGRAALSMGKVDKQGRPDVEAWLKTIKEEQGVDPDIYIHDAVWPSVALKKMVGASVKIEEEDLKKGFEANYGPRVRCLAVVLSNQRVAQDVWARARDNPTSKYFGDLAEQYSVEGSSRALRGEVKPIQRHGGQPVLEQAAFQLQPGELSGVIQVGDKFVVLRCEGYTTPTKVDFAEVRQLIADDLYEKKLRLAMSQEYDRLIEAAQIDNYLAGTTQSGKRTPADGIRPVQQQPALRPAPLDTGKPAAGAQPTSANLKPPAKLR